MASYGSFRIVRSVQVGSPWEIARDFISAGGLKLAFGSTIRFTKDYNIRPEFYDTPEEAYEALKKLRTRR